MPQTSTSALPSAATAAEEELPRPERFADVKGWFWPVDQLLFDWFLAYQRDTDPEGRGDLLELGAYMGKSAIFAAQYLREGEEFTVCDLWDSSAPDDPNSAEMNRSYSTLTRRAFEANYLSFHEELPTLVQAPTSVITSRVRAGSCRFVHVDASHLYEHVHGDIEAARELLQPEGIVAFDDFRAEHCPGVSAAVWGAVPSTGLRPICISGTKLYGTWGDPDAVREALLVWLRTRTDLWHGVEEVAGRPLIRIKGSKATGVPRQPVSRHRPLAEPEREKGRGPEQGRETGAAPGPVPAETTAARPEPAPAASAIAPAPGGRSRGRSRTRRLVKDLLPPILTRALVRVLRSARNR